MNIRELFDQRGVRYSTTGQVTHGMLGMECPFCADSLDPDPSAHLGVHPDEGWYSCWRNPQHRGRTPHRLLWKLLRMPSDEVDSMLGVRTRTNVRAREALTALSANAEREWDKFVPLAHDSAHAYRKYMNRRGVSDASIAQFGLMAAVVKGQWQWRVIFPVRSPHNGAVCTWTARSIGNATPKYLALGRNDGVPLKHTLYNAERVAKSGHTLVICEGPMDAIVLQSLAPYSTVTCTFGVTVSEEQMALIWRTNFTRKILLFDSDAFPQSLGVAKRLGASALCFEQVFHRRGDPGSLTAADKSSLEAVGIG